MKLNAYAVALEIVLSDLCRSDFVVIFLVVWWSNIVFGVLDRVMVKTMCYTSNWF